MEFESKEIQLRNGQRAILRSPLASDASGMIEYLKVCASETEFLLRYPEECSDDVEMEVKFLERVIHSDYQMMIACVVEGKIVGNCEIQFQRHFKTRHRASVAIAIVREYWGQGLGTILFNEMIQLAEERCVSQLELDYIEGNERAKHLYEKMGFVKVAERPNAILLKDGRVLSEISMIRKL